MQGGPKVAEIAALVGDPARANILMALMDGRALTASELAHFGLVTPQTASTHLAKLVDGGILVLAKQGRHRYFRLASPLIGRMLEGIMAVAEGRPARSHPHWRGGEQLRFARVCYDHLAGELAVRLADSLAARKQVLLSDDGGEVTADGEALLRTLGIDVASLTRQRRIFLPTLPRLEHAAAAYRRSCRRGTFGEVHGSGLAQAYQGFARTQRHADRTSTHGRLVGVIPAPEQKS